MMRSGLSNTWKLAGVLFLITLPILIFYIVLFRTAVDLPILDDYQIILDTTNRMSQTSGLGAKLAIVMTSQHNGYKLIFENAVVWTYYILTGHIHILPLVIFGNSLALIVFLSVALMARAFVNDPARLLVLAPIFYLMCQLQYASALNFASSSLQHLAVVAFSLLAIYLMSRVSISAFFGCCAASILAVASSPNGFFLAPVGVFMLAQERRWKRLAVWVALVLCALALYLFHYQGVPSPSGTGHGGVFSTIRNLNPVYALSFLGSSAARYSSYLPSVLLGTLLCGVTVLAIQRRYFRQNPAAFYSMVFILINAVAVSGLRSDSGVAQSLASRYRTYSNLMLALAYLFFVENYLPKWKSLRARQIAVGFALGASMIFCLLSDEAGLRFLNEKKLALTTCYRTQWQSSDAGSSIDGAELEANPALRRQLDAGVYNVNLPTMRESVRLGVYQPPRQP